MLLCVAAAICIIVRAGRSQDTDAVAAARLIEEAFVNAIERAERSVVAISRVPATEPAGSRNALDPFRRRLDPAESTNPADPDYIPEQFGSGVVIENPARPDERFVLTTYQVALGSLNPSAEERSAGVDIYVTLPGRRVVGAETVDGNVASVRGQIEAAHPYVDLAVLRLDLEEAGLMPEDVPALRRGDANHLRKGRLVLALGNPYAQARDGSASVSMGMISNISRRPEPPVGDATLFDRDATIHYFGTLLHVDTRLDIGTSGGALLNLDGDLIGITTALAALQGYEKSVGYAIPLDDGTWRIVQELLNGWEPDLGFMGIAPRTLTRRELRTEGYDRDLPDTAESVRPSAVQAAMVAVDSPAWSAGLRQGDIILSIDERPVYDAPDLMRLVALTEPDTVTRVGIWRPQANRTSVFDVRLGKWPVADDSTLITTRTRFEPWRGILVDYPTARRRFLPSDILATRYPQAVVITEVLSDTPAANAGLAVGDFIQRVGAVDVGTPAEFYAAVAQATGAVELTLLNGERRTISVP